MVTSGGLKIEKGEYDSHPADVEEHLDSVGVLILKQNALLHNNQLQSTKIVPNTLPIMGICVAKM